MSVSLHFSSFSHSCLSFVPHPFLLILLLFLRRESSSFLINSFHWTWRVCVCVALMLEKFVFVFTCFDASLLCYQFSPPESTRCFFFLFHLVRSAQCVGLSVCQLWWMTVYLSQSSSHINSSPDSPAVTAIVVNWIHTAFLILHL